MNKFTPKQATILMVMDALGGFDLSPTEIGEKAGMSYHTASAWACGGLKILVQGEYVKRRQGVKVRYDLTPSGMNAASKLLE